MLYCIIVKKKGKKGSEVVKYGCSQVFEGTLVIGLILRSLWGLYKIHETLWFYLVTL